jgi:hypothetical protein
MQLDAEFTAEVATCTFGMGGDVHQYDKQGSYYILTSPASVINIFVCFSI